MTARTRSGSSEQVAGASAMLASAVVGGAILGAPKPFRRGTTKPAIVIRALGLLVLTATSANAGASFDCGNAATPVERAICADPAIADIDGQVAAAPSGDLPGADTRRGVDGPAAQADKRPEGRAAGEEFVQHNAT